MEKCSYFFRLIVVIATPLFSSHTAKSQQSLIQVNGWNAYVHLPGDYSTSKVYPTIIEFPGLGEVGTDASLVIKYGPGAYLAQGWNGNVGSVEFIVISLQPATSYPGVSFTNAAIASLKSLYKIDPNNLFLTGYSQGGWCASMFVSSDPIGGPYTYASQIKAICTVEGVRPDDNADYPNGFIGFAESGGKDLCLEQINDNRDGGTVVNTMNSTVANSAQFYQTDFGSGGHCCWSNFYGGDGTTPSLFPIGGTNETIYQWFANIVNPNAATTPVISSAAAATGITKGTFNYTITASNMPISYAATGLPAGLSVNKSTGLISGIPIVAGTYTVIISAANATSVGSSTLIITVNLGTVLPLNLISFTGKTNANGNVLSWITSAEVNVDSFSIERSTDAIHFTSIGTVNAGQQQYQFIDSKVSTSSNYLYRLKMIDNNGDYKYSAVLNIEASAKGLTSYSIFPNPVTGSDLYITTSTNVTNKTLVSIINVLGKQWYRGALEAPGLNNSKAMINVSPLPAGTYFIQLRDEKTNAIIMLKFEK